MNNNKAARYTLRARVPVAGAYDPAERSHYLGNLVIKHHGNFYPVMRGAENYPTSTIYVALAYMTMADVESEMGTLGFIDSDGHFTPADDVHPEDWKIS